MTFRPGHIKQRKATHEAVPVFVSISIAAAIYTPISIYVFGHSLAEHLGHFYFIFVGAALVLFVGSRP